MDAEPTLARAPLWKRLALRLLKIAAVVGGLLVVLIMLFESKLIYFPSRYPDGDWTLPEHTADVEFEASDGVKLHGWWLTSQGAQFTVLYLHGNGGNLTTRRAAAEGLRDLGLNVLILDYRGYGRSEGSPSEEGLYRDAEAALAHAESQGFPAGKVILFGESLGTAVASEMAVRHDVAGIILEAPFTNIADMARQIVPIPMGWALRHRYDTLSKAPRFRAPLLVIYGDRDTLVPPPMVERVFAAANVSKFKHEVQGAAHNDIPDIGGSTYYLTIASFVVEAVPLMEAPPKPGLRGTIQ